MGDKAQQKFGWASALLSNLPLAMALYKRYKIDKNFEVWLGHYFWIKWKSITLNNINTKCAIINYIPLLHLRSKELTRVYFAYKPVVRDIS